MLDWGYIAIRSLGSIFMLFVLTRILGKKQISQLTFFEYITGIALGDLVGFMSTDMEANYFHGIVALLVWFAVPLIFEKLALKSKRLRIWLEGKGTVFIRDGKVLENNLKKERYTSDELLEQLRTKSVFNPTDVEFAMLEPSGDLSVLLKEENQPLTPKTFGIRKQRKKPPQAVIMDGVIQLPELSYLGFDKAWLNRELDKLGRAHDQVFLAVADADGGLYVDFYKDQNEFRASSRPIRKRMIRRSSR